MFGTTRTLSENLLDIGEGIVSIFVAAALTYIVGRWVWPICIEWWQERSRKSARAAFVALDNEIKLLQQSKINLFLRQDILSSSLHYSLKNLIEFFGWEILAFLLIIGLYVGPFANFPIRLVARIVIFIVMGMGVVSLYRWSFQRRTVEQLTKSDDLLSKLEKRRERLKKIAGFVGKADYR